jgi:hypothetical protein
MQIRPMVQNDKKKKQRRCKTEKVVICHISTNERGALAMMCGKDEKP